MSKNTLKRYTKITKCPNCGAKPGCLHQRGCDVERCAFCAGQFISCGGCEEEGAKRMPWSGQWSGVAECLEFDWFSRLDSEKGWIPCQGYDKGAMPDLNRIAKEALWDRKLRRFVHPSQVSPRDLLLLQNPLMVLASLTENAEERFTTKGWEMLLGLAQQYGWKPAGTVLMDIFADDEEDSDEYEADYVNDEYEDDQQEPLQEPQYENATQRFTFVASPFGRFSPENPLFQEYSWGFEVTADDALAIADALERALPDLPEADTLPVAMIEHPDAAGQPMLPPSTNVTPLELFSGPRKQDVKDFIALCRAGEFEIRFSMETTDNSFIGREPPPPEDPFPGCHIKVASSKARLNDLEAVRQILAGYTFASETQFRLGPAAGTLELFGEGWPRACKDQVHSGKNRHFLDLLQEFAPYLETTLTVWASFVSQDGEFRGAREWSVSPGATEVEMTEIKPPNRPK